MKPFRNLLLGSLLFLLLLQILRGVQWAAWAMESVKAAMRSRIQATGISKSTCIHPTNVNQCMNLQQATKKLPDNKPPAVTEAQSMKTCNGHRPYYHLSMDKRTGQ